MPDLATQGLKPFTPLRPDCALERIVWEFDLILTAQQLKRVDIPSLVMRTVEQLEIADNKLTARLFLILSELVNNAIDHGLLKLDSELKHSRLGMEHYFEERAARLERLEEGEIRLGLSMVACQDRRCLCIDVRDSGEGFNHSQVIPAISSEVNSKLHGRGISLVRGMSCAMHYSPSGSEVRVCLPLDGIRCD